MIPISEQDDFSIPLSDAEEVERSARRCTFFSSAFSAYNAKLQNIGIHSACMNKSLLGNCIESYFLDIRRLKAFHGMELADRFKIASYSLKWLTKIKPIQIGPLETLPENLQKRGLLINADFAIICSLSIAGIDLSKVEPRLRNGLLYAAHYRDIEPGNMALHLLTLACAYPRISRKT